MATYNPERTYGYTNIYGGISADILEVPNSLQSIDRNKFNAKIKPTPFYENEVIYCTNKTQQISGFYVVIESGYRTVSGLSREHKQFRVLAEITKDHKIIVHSDGTVYKIPFETNFPCTHRDIPDRKLHKLEEYEEYLVETEWLASKLGIESKVIVHHI